MKECKCNVLKAHIQDLGYIILGQGIEPLQDELENVREMSPSRNPKEVKRFLGLVGYHHKFTPHFADLDRAPMSLTKKDVSCNLTKQSQEAFQFLKESLMKEHILRYLDPKNEGYLLMLANMYGHVFSHNLVNMKLMKRKLNFLLLSLT